MRTAAVISVSLHTAVFLIAWFGVPPSARPVIAPERVFEVELTAEADESKQKPKPPSKPKFTPPPPPPPPKPEIVEKPKPEAVPVPKIKQKPPKAKPKPKPKPKKVEKPKPKPKPKKRARAPQPKSKPKPPPRHDFASVLKTVRKLEKKPPPKPKETKRDKKMKPVSSLQKVAELLKRRQKKSQISRLGSEVSRDIVDAVRRQIEPCWSLPAGAQDAGSMIVEIRAILNPNGSVRSAVIVDSARARSDPFYRTMAESARRAMRNPRCQPLKLPLNKYSDWREMIVVFDPREMFGR